MGVWKSVFESSTSSIICALTLTKAPKADQEIITKKQDPPNTQDPQGPLEPQDPQGPLEPQDPVEYP